MAEDFTKAGFMIRLQTGGLDHAIPTINGWLTRGDGAAIYENHDLGHPDIGHVQIVSYGSAAAQIETVEAPERMPDIGNRINWRYTLIGVYKGEPL